MPTTICTPISWHGSRRKKRDHDANNDHDNDACQWCYLKWCNQWNIECNDGQLSNNYYRTELRFSCWDWTIDGRFHLPAMIWRVWGTGRILSIVTPKWIRIFKSGIAAFAEAINFSAAFLHQLYLLAFYPSLAGGSIFTSMLFMRIIWHFLSWKLFFINIAMLWNRIWSWQTLFIVQQKK